MRLEWDGEVIVGLVGYPPRRLAQPVWGRWPNFYENMAKRPENFTIKRGYVGDLGEDSLLLTFQALLPDQIIFDSVEGPYVVDQYGWYPVNDPRYPR